MTNTRNPYITVYETTLETVKEQIRQVQGLNQDAKAEWIREVEKALRTLKESLPTLPY